MNENSLPNISLPVIIEIIKFHKKAKDIFKTFIMLMIIGEKRVEQL